MLFCDRYERCPKLKCFVDIKLSVTTDSIGSFRLCSVKIGHFIDCNNVWRSPPNREIVYTYANADSNQAVNICMRWFVFSLLMFFFLFFNVCENLFVVRKGLRIIECILLKWTFHAYTHTHTGALTFTHVQMNTPHQVRFFTSFFSSFHSSSHEYSHLRSYRPASRCNFHANRMLCLLLWDFSFFIVELWLAAFVFSIKLMAVPLYFQLCN